MRAKFVNESSNKSTTRKLSYKDREGNLYYFTKVKHSSDIWLCDANGKFIDSDNSKLGLIWQWDLKYIRPSEQQEITL